MAAAKRIAAVSIPQQELDQIKSLLEKARNEIPQSWSWSDYQAADVLLIDVDSIYGHMDWLKAQANGRRVLSLTNRAAGEHEIVLTRPVTHATVVAAFRELAADETRRERGDAGESASDAHTDSVTSADLAPASATDRETAAAPAPGTEASPTAPAPRAEVPRADTSAPTPAARVDTPTPVAPVPRAEVVAPAPTAMPAAATPASAPEPVAPVHTGPIDEGTLLEFCTPEQLPQPARIAAGSNPSLTLDLQNNCYFGPTTLKPLVPYCQGTIKRSQWEPVSGPVLQGLREAGGAQPLSRLLWLYTMVNSNGQLLPGLDLNARYKLAKWPQSEREYPKHFRIATAMMKGPAGLPEIADQSGAALADVIDFVNAYSVTGYVAAEGATAATPEMTQPAGLLSRLRARAK